MKMKEIDEVIKVLHNSLNINYGGLLEVISFIEKQQKEIDQYKDLFKKWGLENYSIEELDKWRDRMVWHVNEVVKLDDELHKAKAKQPVRCRECEYYIADKDYCNQISGWNCKPDFYCSYGKHREE